MKDKCLLIQRRLLSYLEGTISEREKADFDKHLFHCPSCQNLVERSEAAYSRLLNEPELDVPPAVWLRIQEKLDKKNQRPATSRYLADRLFPLAAALSLIAAVLFGLELGRMNATARSDPSAQSAGLSFTREYLLDFNDIPDGSLADIYLNPGNHQEDIE